MTLTNNGLSARNADLADLADLLQSQHARKIDMVIPADQLRARHGLIQVAGAEPVVELDGVTDPNGAYRPTAIFDEGVADKLKIPLAYVRRMREERPDLWDANVNGWLHGDRWVDSILDDHGVGGISSAYMMNSGPDERSFMLRAFRTDEVDGIGIARALLSPGYKIIDHLDVITAALEGVREAGVEVKFDGCDLSERRMHVRIVAPEIKALASTLLRGYRSPYSGASGDENPTIFAGFVISNSETGGGAFTLTPRFVVQICNNGMVMRRDAHRSVHLGQKLDDGVIRWSDATQEKNLELVRAQTRDAVTTFLNVDYMTSVIERLEAKSATEITDPAKTIEVIGKQLKLGEERTRQVLDHFIKGGSVTAGGVMHAITSVAQIVADSDEAFDMEAQALDALELASA